MVLMAHPAPYEIPRPTYLAKAELNVIYKGKASHAAAAPWEGINALDATVACYNSISMLRQQMKPTSRVHCIIKDGGLKPNIIPDRSELSFFIRGLTGSDMKELKEKVKDCANGAALQTGCSVEIKDMAPDYLNILTNEPFIQLYIDNAKSLGTPFNDDLATSLASTDMGNVSQSKPSIHPKFKILSEGPNHSINFTTASDAEENHAVMVKKTIGGAKNGGSREVAAVKAPKFYPADDVPVKAPSARELASKGVTKLRKSITPGSVLILLAGRFRGRRVVFLKQLASGLLLVTGPYAVNGVPLRRVNQAYVIATSTKVDVSKVSAKKFEDGYFGKAKVPKSQKKKKKEDDFFAESSEPKEISDARKADQAAVDGALKCDDMMKKYLKARFSLSKRDAPHKMIF